MQDLHEYLASRRARIDHALDRELPPAGDRPARLHEAMRYAVLAGGKRLRPILCMAACEAVSGTADAALPPALALELFHTYTLIHDDLPGMDNDTLRRGKPTCHVQFGEATAILAGDALLTLAFEWLAAGPARAPYTSADYVRELAQAGGSRGVIAGQAEDLAAEGAPSSKDRVAYIHQHKTGDLMRAAARIGGLAGGAAREQLDALTRYGSDVGLAFQIADDILNATSSPEVLGKSTGSDRARGKMTYVSVFGLEEARATAVALTRQAVSAIARLPGPREPLVALAEHMLQRAS